MHLKMKELNTRIGGSLTDRSIQSFSAFLTEISKYPILSLREEEDLYPLLNSEDLNIKASARDRLSKSYMRFVVAVAKRYAHGEALCDAISEGSIGLLRAMDKFDPTFGYKFGSFAVYYIRQAIMDSFHRTGSIVRKPLNAFYESCKYAIGGDPYDDASREKLAEFYGLEDHTRLLKEVILASDDPESSITLSSSDREEDYYMPAELQRVCKILLSDKEQSVVFGLLDRKSVV